MEADNSGESSTSDLKSGRMYGVFHKNLEEKIRPYIDLIDSLRSLGIEKDLALPAIAVIGDQSSGKSSVLEALSGVALPRGSGIVTRCPLVLKLRKLRNGGEWRAVISYRDKKVDISDPAAVEQHVIQAQDELAGGGVGISDELINLEITSPDVCDLTLIDLPGIARVPVGDQPEDIAEQIKHLILKFIERSETINLVVVPCNVDIATTEALKMAKSVDPQGVRTLAILTKPDLVDRGAETDILNIMEGRVIPLKKGYIIVKCRGQNDIKQNMSLAEATQQELKFFREHTYYRRLLDERKASTQCLAKRLTQDFVEHIKMLLPDLTDEVQRKLVDVKEELKQYTGPPEDPNLMERYLINKLMEFHDTVNMLCARWGSEKNLFTRLRPVFREWFEYLRESKKTFQLKMKEVVDDYDEKYRGRELPTMYDYSVFERVMRDHVEELKQPAINVLRMVQEIVQGTFNIETESCFSQYPQLKCQTLTKINDIHTKIATIVDKRVSEYINMEKLIYTQDPTFNKALKESCDKFQDVMEDSYATYDVRELVPDKLQAYYEVFFQRFADYIPMLTLHFILKESGHQLCVETMEIRSGCNVAELLREDSEASYNRMERQERLKRLKQAHEQLLNI